MNMKTSPNDVSNARILEEMQKLHASDTEIRKELRETTGEILEVLGAFSDKVDERFEKVEGEIAGIKREMVTKEELKSEIDRLKTTMITKGFLEDKLADFHSDIIQHTRKEIERAMR